MAVRPAPPSRPPWCTAHGSRLAAPSPYGKLCTLAVPHRLLASCRLATCIARRRLGLHPLKLYAPRAARCESLHNSTAAPYQDDSCHHYTNHHYAACSWLWHVSRADPGSPPSIARLALCPLARAPREPKPRPDTQTHGRGLHLRVRGSGSHPVCVPSLAPSPPTRDLAEADGPVTPSLLTTSTAP